MAKKKQSRHTLAEIDLAVDLVNEALSTPVVSIEVSGSRTVAIGEYAYTISENPSNANIHVTSLDVEVTKV